MDSLDISSALRLANKIRTGYDTPLCRYAVVGEPNHSQCIVEPTNSFCCAKQDLWDAPDLGLGVQSSVSVCQLRRLMVPEFPVPWTPKISRPWKCETLLMSSSWMAVPSIVSSLQTVITTGSVQFWVSHPYLHAAFLTTS